MKFYAIEITQNKERVKITFMYVFNYPNAFEHIDIVNAIGKWCKHQIISDSYLRSIGFINKFPVFLKITTDNYSECFEIKKAASFKDKMLARFWAPYTMVSTDTKTALKKSSLDNVNFNSIRLDNVQKIVEKMRRIEISVPMGGAGKKK